MKPNGTIRIIQAGCDGSLLAVLLEKREGRYTMKAPETSDQALNEDLAAELLDKLEIIGDPQGTHKGITLGTDAMFTLMGLASLGKLAIAKSLAEGRMASPVEDALAQLEKQKAALLSGDADLRFPAAFLLQAWEQQPEIELQKGRDELIEKGILNSEGLATPEGATLLSSMVHTRSMLAINSLFADKNGNMENYGVVLINSYHSLWHIEWKTDGTFILYSTDRAEAAETIRAILGEEP